MAMTARTNQTTLDFERHIAPRDPNVAAADVPRLSGQNAKILERLRQGPATTDELAQISRKYTSRISDLRLRGIVIQCHRVEGGNNLYRLVMEGGNAN